MNPLTKDILIDAINGAGFPSQLCADHYTRVGLARFTGNQHNESWSWDKQRLAQLDEATLHMIYSGLKAKG